MRPPPSLILTLTLLGFRPSAAADLQAPVRPALLIQPLMEEFLLLRERSFAPGGGGTGRDRMLALLEELGPLAGWVPGNLGTQVEVFRQKGYTFLAQSGDAVGQRARVLCTSILERLRPPVRNVTYLDWGDVKVIYRGDSQRKEIALTYDDGPIEGSGEGSGTRAVLAELARHDARATFYLVGRQARAYPHLLHEILAGGHTIGNHTLSHARGVGLSKLGDQAIRQEIGEADRIIRDLSGLGRLDTFRLPYGAGIQSRKVHTILGEYHPYNVYWTIDTRDWKKRGAQRTFESVVNSGSLNGAIVLLHDHAPGVARATRQILETLVPRGYQFVSVETLLGVDPRILYASRLVRAAQTHLESHHREAYQQFLDLARQAPSPALGREALDYAYQIARGFLDQGEALTARQLLARSATPVAYTPR